MEERRTQPPLYRIPVHAEFPGNLFEWSNKQAFKNHDSNANRVRSSYKSCVGPNIHSAFQWGSTQAFAFYGFFKLNEWSLYRIFATANPDISTVEWGNTEAFILYNSTVNNGCSWYRTEQCDNQRVQLNGAQYTHLHITRLSFEQGSKIVKNSCKVRSTGYIWIGNNIQTSLHITRF
jgi:hypothetical protein